MKAELQQVWYQDFAIYLNGDTCSEGLPNFIDSYSYSNTIDSCSKEGVNEVNIGNSISVFPNPTSGKFVIQTKSQQLMTNSHIEIYNVMGKKVFSSIISSPLSIINLDTPNGIYFIQLKTSYGIATNKISIQK